jgi:peptidoglycan/LPS O-acetylase OafA/YrhL
MLPVSSARGASRSRNLGLDLIRSTAIALVLLAHGLSFFFRWYYLQLRELFYILAFLGVELFFVLSGFLIGSIILEDVLRERAWPSLGRFYVRRWFRTLPPYYLMVIVLLAAGRPFTWRSLVFLQNLRREDLDFFPVSWSLSIEEWFYLLVPFALLLAARLGRRRPRAAFFGACLAIVALSLAARFAWVAARQPQWNFGVRYQPFLRMDSLMVGVTLAGIDAYCPKIWAYLASRRRLLFPLALAGLFYTGFYQLFLLFRTRIIDSSVYARTTYFLLVSLTIGAILVALQTSRSLNAPKPEARWPRVVRWLSVTSYAAYLIHLPVFDLLSPLEQRLDRPAISFALVLVGLALTLALSSAMYTWYERPILRVRDSLTHDA